jgi:hypothetical protein
MSSATYSTHPVEAVAAPTLATRRRVSWGAIFVGTILAIVVSLTLNTLGAAIGANMVDATQQSTPDAASFGMAGGIWLLVVNLIALGIGAYAAARLSGAVERGDATLHGLAVWATATVLAVMLVGNIAGRAVSTAGAGLSSIVGGLASGAGNAAAAAGREASDRTDNNTLRSLTDQVTERARNALTAPSGEPSQMTPDQRKAEIGRLVAQRMANGQLPQQDQDRLVALVAAEGGISQDEARTRIQQAEQQAQQALNEAEQRARQAADAAARAASIAGYWVFATLLLGAVVAALAGRGGVRRDVLYR